MHRLEECLPVLGDTTRRVLVLRAGIGPAHPRSRAAVAQALDLRRSTVGRIEHRGVRILRQLNRDTACGDASATASTATAGVSVMTGSGASVTGIPTGTGGGAGAVAGASDARAAGASGDGGGGVKGAVLGEADQLPPAVAPGPRPKPRDLTPLLIALALGGLIWMGVRTVRERMY